MNSAVHYGSNIIAPAISGVLYPIIGLAGILPIVLATFLIAGALSDRFLEPAMQSETILSSVFAPIFGNDAGAGIALLYVSCAMAMFAVGAVGFKLSQLDRLQNKVSEE